MSKKHYLLVCLRKIAQCLRFSSFGKYNHGLYLNDNLSESSILGGLITITFLSFLIGYSFYILTDIFNKDHYNLDQKFEHYNKNYDLLESLTF